MMHTSYSPQETRQAGKELLRRLGTTHIVLLSGELGSGKTVLTQAVAEELGVAETVASPTYVLLKVYELSGQPYRRLVHVDLYRIEYNQDTDELGLTDYLADPESLVMVEWPERILGNWPSDALWVRFDFGDKETVRTIDF